MDEPMHEQAAVLALVRASHNDWYQTADVIAEAGSAVRMLAGEMPVMSAERRQRATELLSRVSPADVSEAQALIERVTSQGVRLITITDDDYPENLKLIFNRPLYLGAGATRLGQPAGHRGSRRAQATDDGRATAARLPAAWPELGFPSCLGWPAASTRQRTPPLSTLGGKPSLWSATGSSAACTRQRTKAWPGA